MCAGGIKLIPLLGGNQINAQSAEHGTAESLEKLFVSPADDAWPWTYWYSQNGNITREAITADLESMHRVGIRGVLYMEVDTFFPKGPVRSQTPEWRELMEHAMSESTRLGMTLNFNNDGGWAGSAGPWITPELSMQVVVWSEKTVEGPSNVSIQLAQPKSTLGYYNDIAVIAFPIPPGEGKLMVDCSPKLTYGEDRKEFDFAKVLDGNPGTSVSLPRPSEGKGQYLNIDFPEPFTAQAVSIALDALNNGMSVVTGAVEASDDGTNYRTIRKMSLYWPNSSVNFPKVSSRHYRILIDPNMFTDWIEREYANGIPLGEIQLHAAPRIEDIPGKAVYLRQGTYSDENDALTGEPEFPEDTVIRSGQILDISKKMGPDGVLKWDAPPGRWTVLRFGHTSTGKVNHTAPKEVTGLECDKLSKKAIEVQFDALVGRLLEDQAAVGAKALKMTHIDSWEAGSQNWTLGFREEFQTRRGYDPIPLLPILTGRVIEDREHSERFLWDLRRTVADLLLENYAGHLREIAHRHGLTLSIEAYGAGPLDELAYAGCADVPMGEFWVGHDSTGEIFNNISNKAMASSAHTYGRPIVAAEAFTAYTVFAAWNDHPFRLKPLGDLAFTWGINRFVLSEYMLQPWEGRKPGMTLGAWGTHFDRNNTWWEQSLSWNTYLARCQTLLQSGQFIADVAYLGSENAPYSEPWTKDLDPPLPPGYDYDFLPPQVLLADATVQDGRIVLKSGMSYRLLALQPGRAMTPALLRKIKQLVNDGATVVGPRPVNSPSLSDFPHCDDEVRQLAEELWGECDGSSIKENRLGNGRVVWGRMLSDVLLNISTLPDFDCYETAVGVEIRFIHRSINGDDFYFVASGSSGAKTFLCTFRPGGKGKKPELWWPDSGRIEAVSVFTESSNPVGVASDEMTVNRISIPISLEPYGSVFVVFRASAEPQPDHIVAVQRDDAAIYGPPPVLEYQFSTTDVKQDDDKRLFIETAEQVTYKFVTARNHSLKAEIPQLPSPISIQGPWELHFPKNLGAPDHVTLDRLISWTEHSDPGVKYFSGTATYRNRFILTKGMLGPERRIYLDLGRVCVIAEVVLNGNNLGVLWKPPFIVDVTDAVTAESNELEIRVVNLWPNRLIGDEQLPDDCEWATPSSTQDPFPKRWGLEIDHWPQWLLDNKPSPTGRIAFTTWKHWFKDDPLLESGILGPVRVFAKARVRLTS